jgi:hypothetical protein
MYRSYVDEVDPSERQLYWVLMFALYPFFSESSHFALNRILSQEGAVRGSPGWEIDFIEDEFGDHVYHVWADSVSSGMEPADQFYRVETVRDAVRESLLYLGRGFPEKTSEISKVIVDYNLK